MTIAYAVTASGYAEDRFIDPNDPSILAELGDPWRDTNSPRAPKHNAGLLERRSDSTSFDREALIDRVVGDQTLADQAIKFLKAACSNNVTRQIYENGRYFQYDVYTLTGDERTLRIEHEYRSDVEVNSYHDDTRHESTNIVQFSELSPDISVDGTDVKLECTQTDCIRYNTGKGARGKVSSINIKFCDDRAAQRSAKALSFLIKYNGGKSSPF